MSQLLFEQKRSARNTAIDELVAKSKAGGGCTDRLYWTIIYDFEHAPMTTNLAQLTEIGVDLTALESLHDDEVAQALDAIITGLARLSIFLLNTNHLTDRALHERLVTAILVEPVRDLPPDAGVEEFVDLQGGTASPDTLVDVCNRDDHLPRPKPRLAAFEQHAASDMEGGAHES